MGKSFATCGHEITDYPWDWPAVWSLGFHGWDGWSYSVLCFPCIMEVYGSECKLQFSEPDGEDWKLVPICEDGFCSH